MKLFAFHIPDEIKQYLKTKSKEEYTTMAKYLVHLILEDKRKNEHQQNKSDN